MAQRRNQPPSIVRPRRSNSVLPEIVLFSLCALTLFLGLGI